MSQQSFRSIMLNDLAQSSQEVQRLSQMVIDLTPQVGVTLSDAQARLCVEHLLYVLQINEYMNLTRITKLDEAVLLHIIDSLSLVPYLNPGASNFLDMGTGPGFPGVPLHLATGLTGVLLDSVGKKVHAVQTILDRLSLSGVHAEHGRIEEFALSHRNSFDAVVARALAPLPILLEYAAPLLAQGGQLLVSKGNPDDSEIDAGNRVAAICGFTLERDVEVALPYDKGHRVIYSFVKTREPRIKLPRPVGTAKRNPLA